MSGKKRLIQKRYALTAPGEAIVSFSFWNSWRTVCKLFERHGLAGTFCGGLVLGSGLMVGICGLTGDHHVAGFDPLPGEILVYCGGGTKEATSGGMKPLNLGVSASPRMAQAAFHSHVSNVEMPRCSSARAGRAMVVTLGSAVFWRGRLVLDFLAIAIF
jgi:hypothetical protein